MKRFRRKKRTRRKSEHLIFAPRRHVIGEILHTTELWMDLDGIDAGCCRDATGFIYPSKHGGQSSTARAP